MVVSIPVGTNKLKIHHMKFLKELHKYKGKNISPIKKCQMCSEFLRLNNDKLKKYSTIQIEDLFEQITVSVGQHIKEFPNVVEYEGQEYERVQDFKTLPVEWFADFSNTDLENSPETIAAMCYIEKGMDYNQTGDNEVIVNSRSKRAKVFADHMPLNIFIELEAFFLSVWKG